MKKKPLMPRLLKYSLNEQHGCSLEPFPFEYFSSPFFMYSYFRLFWGYILVYQIFRYFTITNECYLKGYDVCITVKLWYSYSTINSFKQLKMKYVELKLVQTHFCTISSQESFEWGQQKCINRTRPTIF